MRLAAHGEVATLDRRDGAAHGALDLAHAAPCAPPAVSTAYAAALADLPRLLPGNGYEPYGLPELRQRIADRFTRRWRR